jgi:hypothetical protein
VSAELWTKYTEAVAAQRKAFSAAMAASAENRLRDRELDEASAALSVARAELLSQPGGELAGQPEETLVPTPGFTASGAVTFSSGLKVDGES